MLPARGLRRPPSMWCKASRSRAARQHGRVLAGRIAQTMLPPVLGSILRGHRLRHSRLPDGKGGRTRTEAAVTRRLRINAESRADSGPMWTRVTRKTVSVAVSRGVLDSTLAPTTQRHVTRPYPAGAAKLAEPRFCNRQTAVRQILSGVVPPGESYFADCGIRPSHEPLQPQRLVNATAAGRRYLRRC
jgi:hypothetical protein